MASIITNKRYNNPKQITPTKNRYPKLDSHAKANEITNAPNSMIAPLFSCPLYICPKPSISRDSNPETKGERFLGITLKLRYEHKKEDL